MKKDWLEEFKKSQPEKQVEIDIDFLIEYSKELAREGDIITQLKMNILNFLARVGGREK